MKNPQSGRNFKMMDQNNLKTKLGLKFSIRKKYTKFEKN